MKFSTARDAVDYLISNPELFPQENVVFDFIGGEPLLEISLMDSICDYIKVQLYTHKHRWFSNYKFNISTNGLLYSDKRVQDFIYKNKNALSLTISIDGTKSKHDANRVYANGRGSYDDVIKQIPKWLHDFPNASSKVTVSSSDIPYLAESILHLFDLGIHTVNSNVVYENVWKDGDDRLFETQLMKLADNMIENKYYRSCTCSFFDSFIGKPVSDNNNWCGTGMSMLALDSNGFLYPCIRFMDFSLSNKKPRVVGNLKTGLDMNKLRPFLSLDRKSQSNFQCLNCDVASGCAWCTGHNYDSAKTETIFERATFICKMHKARVRAKEYYWKRMDETTGTYKYVNVLLSNISVSFCHYQYKIPDKIEWMTPETLNNIVSFCSNKNLSLNFIYPKIKTSIPYELNSLIELIPHTSIIPYGLDINAEAVVIEGKDFKDLKKTIDLSEKAIILLISKSDISQLPKMFECFCKNCLKLSVILLDIPKYSKEDIFIYKKALEQSEFGLLDIYKKAKRSLPEINIITDLWFSNTMHNCNAGIDHITCGPNGKLYICPAFYQNDNNDGILDDINIKNKQLLEFEFAPICRECDAFHCLRCVYLNKILTDEINTPSWQQCQLAHIEREFSRKLLLHLKKENPLFLQIRDISPVYYSDPLEKIIKKRK